LNFLKAEKKLNIVGRYLPMVNFEIHDSLKSISEVEIGQVESRLSIHLPQDYKNFLLSHNGGRTEPWMMFNIQGNESDSHAIAGFFFGIGGDGNIDLEANRRVYSDRVPENILPIASDPGGNLLCISVSGEDEGKLYFWTHEEECEEGETPSYENLYPVADNFENLLQSLTPVNF
jgi:SMI1-KNR4 cell-wall